MNQKETEIDSLTRSLMRGVTEQPPASLNARIMSLVGKQRLQPVKTNLGRSIPPGFFLIGFFFYLALISLGALCLFGPSGETFAWLDTLRKVFPLLLIAGGGSACFFCFTQLDNWLFAREKERFHPVSPDTTSM